MVAVYDVGEDEAVGPYLVFEYVAGSTLKHILRGRGPLPPADVVKLGRQLASALDTAHAAGVIHRDIKPDNILVSATGDAKLADFGVARVPDAALTKEGQFLGTPCYAAPETLDEARYGPHSDLFSFAAVLYEAVTAVRAFPGDDAISVAHRVVNDDPEPPSAVAKEREIPKEVDRVLMRGLSKEAEERHASASELVEDLRRAYVAAGLVEDDATGAQPLSPRPPSGKGSSWAFGLVLGGGLAVGGRARDRLRRARLGLDRADRRGDAHHRGRSGRRPGAGRGPRGLASAGAGRRARRGGGGTAGRRRGETVRARRRHRLHVRLRARGGGQGRGAQRAHPPRRRRPRRRRRGPRARPRARSGQRRPRGAGRPDPRGPRRARGALSGPAPARESGRLADPWRPCRIRGPPCGEPSGSPRHLAFSHGVP
ncbi:MAG: serine/threonine protein kinase [Sandaracinaceae bacterium]|nr:serine/threonine protein kinase [Sandaracinaceae bacterium]